MKLIFLNFVYIIYLSTNSAEEFLNFIVDDGDEKPILRGKTGDHDSDNDEYIKDPKISLDDTNEIHIVRSMYNQATPSDSMRRKKIFYRNLGRSQKERFKKALRLNRKGEVPDWKTLKKKYVNKDVLDAKTKAGLLLRARNRKGNTGQMNEEIDDLDKKEHYVIDSVLNAINHRRKGSSSSKDTSESSSRETMDWKEEWRQYWMQKKFEALNSSVPRGDTVNMVAARPWGVSCGDPNQHDMPWGTCMLPVECEAEYRIYRGDLFCGRSQFICCALQLTSYDLYQGFEATLEDKSLSTDTEELKNQKSKENKGKKRGKSDKKKRRKNRDRRKRKIKKNIRRIVREIRKILNKMYKNGTKERKRKTKQLNKFIKNLKKQFRKDRESVKFIHEEELIKIDARLQAKLNQLYDFNKEFADNPVFREMLVNGTMSKKGARMLLAAYPELSSYFRTDSRRRNGGAGKDSAPTDYLEYDIEYGFLYY